MERLKVDLFDFKKNPNIGTYIFVTNKFALVPFDTPKYEKEKIKEVLQVPVFEAKINESDLLGVYLFGNDEKVVIPEGFELLCEVDLSKKFGTRFFEIKTDFNALSNNVALTEKAIITHEKFKELGKDLAEIFEKELILLNEKDFDVIGSSIKANKFGLLINPEFSEESKEKLKKLNLKVIEGTVNDENIFVSTGLLVNDKGILVGNLTKGEEILKIEEAFQPNI
jgi:translation initiation factor 6 (eIF-6)